MTRQQHRDTFPRDRWIWLQSLTKEQREAKLQLSRAVGEGDPLFGKAMKARTTAAAAAAIPTFEKVVAQAHAATDSFWEANACFYLAYLHEFQLKYFETCYYYKRGETIGRNAGYARQKIEDFQLSAKLKVAADKGRLKPEFINTEVSIEEAKTKYKEALEKGTAAAMGGGGDDLGSDKPGSKKRGSGSGKFKLPPPPTDHKGASMEWKEDKGLRVKKVKNVENYWTTFVASNGDWWNWRFVQVERGQKVRFPFLPGKVELENDGGKFFLIREGKKKERLKLRSKPAVTEFKDVAYLDGSQGRVYQCLLLRPSSFKCMGYAMRGGGPIATIYAKGASNVTGKIRGVDFAIHDSTANGAFNDWGLDTIVIGKGKKAMMAPLSRYVNLNGLMYELKVNANGKTIRTKPWDGDMAPLKVNFKANMKPRSLIASGTGGDATYFINLLDAMDKPIWVVPGNHQFSHGYFAQGKGIKAKSIQIWKGRSGVQNVEVAQMNTWDFGGAGGGFTFGFKTETRKKKGQEYVVIPAKNLKVYGAFGEEYGIFLTGHVLPEVSMRKGKDGPIWLQKKKMRKPETADYNKDFSLIWVAKTLEVKKASAGDYSVMMEADYPPLGKIVSSWQAGE
jgi:hypothetical protein